MSAPTEHKIVQARILAYAQEIGWTLMPPVGDGAGYLKIPLLCQ